MNCKNLILVLKPTNMATAPSKDPCGNPMKKINRKEIMFKEVSSIICYLNIDFTNSNLGMLLIIFNFVIKLD